MLYTLEMGITDLQLSDSQRAPAITKCCSFFPPDSACAELEHSLMQMRSIALVIASVYGDFTASARNWDYYAERNAAEGPHGAHFGPPQEKRVKGDRCVERQEIKMTFGWIQIDECHYESDCL